MGFVQRKGIPAKDPSLEKLVINHYLNTGEYEYKNGEYVRMPGLGDRETLVECQTKIAELVGETYSK